MRNGGREKHFVATGYVVRGGKTLLLLHKKLKMWLPPGGHIEPGELPEEALLREIREETGLDVEILSPKRFPDPQEDNVKFLHVPSHVQLEDLPNHPQHIDLIYFCRARDGQDPRFSEDESAGIRWLSPTELGAPEIRDEVRQIGRQAIRYVAGLSNGK